MFPFLPCKDLTGVTQAQRPFPPFLPPIFACERVELKNARGSD